MKDQRGSVTVIAIAMLLFLMLIAVAWLLIIGSSRPGMPPKPVINVLWHNWKQAIVSGVGYQRQVG